MTGLIGTLIGIVIVLIILGVLWWGVQQLMPLIPLGEPFRTLIRVLVTIIMVFIILWIILVLLGAAGFHVPGPFRIAGSSAFAVSAATAGYLCGVLNA